MPDMMGKESMHDNMTGDAAETVMVPKSICPGMTWKPGDEMVLKVKNVQGDMLEMEYAPSDDQEMSDEEMNNPPKEMMNMPSDKMRDKLPKAQREGY